ncbi:MAG: hypothetical protein KDD45_06580 [Bdellovibrionales bacterium]|nr:hypothetical protein [Bdellovibrionales bacterium]
MISPKASDHTNTNYSPLKRNNEKEQAGSQSEVEAYGTNFGDYVESDPNGVGMIQSRKAYFPSYGSSVEVPRDLVNSSATYRSGHQQYINSSQYIRM